MDLDDLADQLDQLQKMGGLGGIMGMLPGVAKAQKQMAEANIDETMIRRQRDHLLDDAGRTQSPKTHSGVPQTPDRSRFGDVDTRRQQAAQAVSNDETR